SDLIRLANPCEAGASCGWGGASASSISLSSELLVIGFLLLRPHSGTLSMLRAVGYAAQRPPRTLGHRSVIRLGRNEPRPSDPGQIGTMLKWGRKPDYSTVTDLARLRGWSTSVPMTTAV